MSTHFDFGRGFQAAWLLVVFCTAATSLMAAAGAAAGLQQIPRTPASSKTLGRENLISLSIKTTSHLCFSREHVVFSHIVCHSHQSSFKSLATEHYAQQEQIHSQHYTLNLKTYLLTKSSCKNMTASPAPKERKAKLIQLDETSKKHKIIFINLM